MIKNLIFDIGGVLVDFRPAGVLKDMGISEERARVILRESIASPLWHEMDRGAIPEEEVIAGMSRRRCGRIMTVLSRRESRI